MRQRWARKFIPTLLALLLGALTPASGEAQPTPAADEKPLSPEDRKLKTDRKAAEGRCREKARIYREANERLEKALANETNDWIIYNRNREYENARDNYCLCLASIWQAVNPGKPLPPEWDEYCGDRPPFDIDAERSRRGIGGPIRKGMPPQPGAPPDMSDVPVPCTEKYEAYEERRKELQEGNRAGGRRDRTERPDRQALREKVRSDYRSLCDCWKDMAPYLYEEYCTWSEQGAPPDLRAATGKAAPQPGAPPTGTEPDAPVPPPPPPPPPPSGNTNPNAPAPPVPGLPAPPGPGMPAADCLRDGVWNVTFTVEQHNDNHDHTVCVRFLRRLIQMTLGDFLGDLFAARFEDLLPEMRCTKIPGCSGGCKGTLPNFAGKENVEFEIQNLRRSGDAITGRLVITSGGQTLFSFKFTARAAVSA